MIDLKDRTTDQTSGQASDTSYLEDTRSSKSVSTAPHVPTRKEETDFRSSSPLYKDAREDLLNEQTRMLHENSSILFWLSLICGCFTYYILQPDEGISLALNVWLALHVGLSTLRLSLTWLYKNRPQALSVSTYMHLFTAGVLIGGANWGVAGSFFLPEYSTIHQAVLLAEIAGLTIFATSVYSHYMPAFLMFVLPSAGLILPQLMMKGETTTQVFAQVAVIFYIFIFYSAYRINIASKKSLNMLLEHREMIQELDQQKNVTSRINDTLNQELLNSRHNELELSAVRDTLEKTVAIRTRALLDANTRLKDEIEGHKATAEKLSQSEAHLARVLKVNQVSLWDWSLEQGHLIISDYANQINGQSEESVHEGLLENIQDIAVDEDIPLVQAAIQAHLEGKTREYLVQYRVHTSNGSMHWVEDRGKIVDADASGTPTRLIGTRTDITYRKETEDKLSYLVNYDELTGLANRPLLKDRLHAALRRVRENNSNIAVLLIDIDRFKSVNDSLGMDVGDELLKMVANRLSEACESADTIARLGSNEYVVILENFKDKKALANHADYLLGFIRKPYLIKDHEILITASMGISMFPDTGKELQILLNQAIVARRNVSQLGGDTYRFYTHDLQENAGDRLGLEINLRKAILNREFEVFYQPKMDLRSGKVMSVEALVRWKHPALGLISPSRFIPIAEEIGLIGSIGEMVLETACYDAARWHRESLKNVKVSVNVSAQQFRKGSLKETVASMLDKTGLHPSLLELELTESLLMENSGDNLQLLKELDQMGVSLSIDDFGTGYSSLGYLKKFPIDVLKIDQSFIRDIDHGSQDLSIIQAVIAMARGLNMRVIAEGVESDHQLEILKQEGCHEVQGYFISKPLTVKELYSFIRHKNNSTKQTPAPSLQVID